VLLSWIIPHTCTHKVKVISGLCAASFTVSKRERRDKLAYLTGSPVCVVDGSTGVSVSNTSFFQEGWRGFSYFTSVNIIPSRIGISNKGLKFLFKYMADILLSDIQVGFHSLIKLMSDILYSRDERNGTSFPGFKLS